MQVSRGLYVCQQGWAQQAPLSLRTTTDVPSIWCVWDRCAWTSTRRASGRNLLRQNGRPQGQQFGLESDNYPCSFDGNDCTGKIFAASVPGVIPSASLTWFQAQQACLSVGKRLPTNAEWQGAAAGTPDTGDADDHVTTCNTDGGPRDYVPTGSRKHCVSNFGVYDMVGNAGRKGRRLDTGRRPSVEADRKSRRTDGSRPRWRRVWSGHHEGHQPCPSRQAGRQCLSVPDRSRWWRCLGRSRRRCRRICANGSPFAVVGRSRKLSLCPIGCNGSGGPGIRRGPDGGFFYWPRLSIERTADTTTRVQRSRRSV